MKKRIRSNPDTALHADPTNTIAQGDTREVGLDRMVRAGFTITRAIQSASWPGSAVSLKFAAVWGSVGPVVDGVPRISDNEPVKQITTLLEAGGRVEGNAARLHANAGIAFVGCYVLGMGFILEPEEARAWITEDPRNGEVLFPYFSGEDLYTRPDCSAARWVIDFGDLDLESASQYERPFDRLQKAVFPERQLNNRKVYRDYWWQFAEKRPAMRRNTANLDELLVITRVSKTVMPVRVSAGGVFSEATVIFATNSYADQAILSSSLHQIWAVKYSSTALILPRYTPSDVFETFPRAVVTKNLEEIGRVIDTERRSIMLRRELGLTKLYNLVNDRKITDVSDADIARLRAIHVELDEAVMAAYGWSDVRLDHGFHIYRQMERWTVSPAARVEILDRLLEKNHRRAAEEAKQAPKAKSKGRRGKNAPYEQGTLL